MNADDINDIRDIFRDALLDWDVPVSVQVVDENSVEVKFTLWGTFISGDFYLEKGQWSDGNDCPHFLDGETTVWQWIAMKLHEKIKP